jgi:Flp pilus assembly protein TadG
MKRIETRGIRIPARSSQSGAAAIEFALVFPLLLALTYASLVYSYVYFLQQSINFAAQQGVQAAVAVVPTSNASTDLANRINQANAVESSTLSWLPSNQVALISTSPAKNATSDTTSCVGATPSSSQFVYQVTFTLTGLFPALVNLPMGLGTVPPLPATLTACAVAFT